jgi:hypothetical protein
VQALASHVIYGPGKARFDDHALAVYEQAGFTGSQADQAAAAVFTYVLGNAVGDAATVALMRRLRRDGGDAGAQLKTSMAEAVEIASQFPRLKARIGQPAAEYNAAPDDTFEIGLTALVNGLHDRLTNGFPE